MGRAIAPGPRKAFREWQNLAAYIPTLWHQYTMHMNQRSTSHAYTNDKTAHTQVAYQRHLFPD